jgi:hypothetical protein
MKRPSYFHQAVPSRRGSGLPILAPPRLLFRPDPSAAAAFVETADAPAPRGSRPPGASSTCSPPPGRHVVAAPKQWRIAHAPAVSAGTAPPRRPDPVASDWSAPRPMAAAAPPRVAPVLAPPPSPSTIASPPPPRSHPRQTEQSRPPVPSRTVEIQNDSRPPAPREAPSVPIAPPRERMREPKFPDYARSQSALPVITPPPQVAPVRQAQTRAPVPPSLHIGTLEVHVLPPAPVPQPAAAAKPQPRASGRQMPAGRLARGFGIFGLGQS